MGSLDAYKDEIIPQLLRGDWKNLFPKYIYTNLTAWMKRQTDKDSIVVRFTFFNPKEESDKSKDIMDSRYALYVICDPMPKATGKVSIHDVKLADDELPLAMPPTLYKKPLFNMPLDLLEEILKKKKSK